MMDFVGALRCQPREQFMHTPPDWLELPAIKDI
jgi:hypothetical protein